MPTEVPDLGWAFERARWLFARAWAAGRHVTCAGGSFAQDAGAARLLGSTAEDLGA